MSTGWDTGTYKVFYLCAAILSVPWLALGTIFVLFGGPVGRRVRGWLVFFSGLALGTLVLSSGGLLQGFVGHDEAFALTLAVGIAVIYSGFLVADGTRVRPEHQPAAHSHAE